LGAAHERDAGKPPLTIELTHDGEYCAPFLFLYPMIANSFAISRTDLAAALRRARCNRFITLSAEYTAAASCPPPANPPCRWYHAVGSRGTASRSVVPILSRFLERPFVSPRERQSFQLLSGPLRVGEPALPTFCLLSAHGNFRVVIRKTRFA
jgi:hypothetical protein